MILLLILIFIFLIYNIEKINNIEKLNNIEYEMEQYNIINLKGETDDKDDKDDKDEDDKPKIKLENKNIILNFTNYINNNVLPLNSPICKLYYKDEDELFGSEKKFKDGSWSIDIDNLDYNSWSVDNIEYDKYGQNHIINLKKNKIYYIFLEIKLNEKSEKSEKSEIIKVMDNSRLPVYSPNIFQITKDGNKATLIFKRSFRDTSLPESPFRYEIYYIKESDIEFISPSPSPIYNYIQTVDECKKQLDDLVENNSIDLLDSIKKHCMVKENRQKINPGNDLKLWNKKDHLCNYLTCELVIEGLANEPYHFFILQVKNGKKSTINNIVRVSNNVSYKLIESHKPIELGALNKEEKKENIKLKCEDYDIKKCPDEVNGTILSRCYKDKNFDKCIQTLEEEYLQ